MNFKLNFTSQPLLIEIIISIGLRIHFKLNNTLNEIVVRGNMYTKTNFLCSKLRKMSTKGKKASVYFRSGGRFLDSSYNVLLILKCILNPIETIISIVVVISIVVAM